MTDSHDSRGQAEDASSPFHLVRLGGSSRGDTIHRSTCRYAKRPNALRWKFADYNPDYDWATEAPWLKACQVCRPPSPFDACPSSSSEGSQDTGGAER